VVYQVSCGGGAYYYACRVIEIQAFLIEIVGKFELALTEKPERIRRLACVLMAPTVEGEVKNGVHMTLRVSVAPRNEKEC
jgi:hypothetical protein